MARRYRFRIPGLSHHVVQRGNNRLDIFRTPQDCELFLALVDEAARRHQLDVDAYVLMRTHFHLVVTPRTPTALEKAMHAVDFQYARYFNGHYSRTGALYEGRYRTTVIETDVYWYSCLRYVELNPVRAGVVAQPDDYRWSSYAAHAFGAPDRLVTLHPLYTALGRTPYDQQCAWRTMCGRGLTVDELGRIRTAVHSGGVLGRIVIPET